MKRHVIGTVILCKEVEAVKVKERVVIMTIKVRGIIVTVMMS
jgi:hypothetical protein